MSPSIIVIAHNLRSAHNVGSLLRTCEGLGIQEVLLTGYTPFPAYDKGDKRMPHIASKVNKAIRKTALGAEQILPWQQFDELETALRYARERQYSLIGLEQHTSSIPLTQFKPPSRMALMLGNEVTGIDPQFMPFLDAMVEIPMRGKKESFNVVQAAAMCLYACTYGIPS